MGLASGGAWLLLVELDTLNRHKDLPSWAPLLILLGLLLGFIIPWAIDRRAKK